MEHLKQRVTKWSVYFRFYPIEQRAKKHLQKVYATLAVTVFTAAVGAYINLASGTSKYQLCFTQSHSSVVDDHFLESQRKLCASWLCVRLPLCFSAYYLVVLVAFGSILAVSLTPHSKKNEFRRFLYLQVFALCLGWDTGPAIKLMIHVNPSIFVSALAATVVIFVCFSLAALIANDQKFLFLGDTLGLIFFCMVILGIANIFFDSDIIFQFQICGLMVVACGSVLFDTQAAIHKRRLGDDDHIWHSFELLMDVGLMFRYLICILLLKVNIKKLLTAAKLAQLNAPKSVFIV